MDTSSLEHALKQHAYIISQSILALAKIEGMKAENETCILRKCLPRYEEEDFEKAMKGFDIDYNSVISAFNY